MTDIVIAGAVRTPVGAFNGGLASLPAHKLGEVAIVEALRRAEVEPKEVSEVIMGQILAAGEGQNPARQAAIGAGLPFEVTAYGVNQLCGSGLRTVALGYQAIRNGDSEIVVAGGQESMSQAPHCIHLRNGVKMGDARTGRHDDQGRAVGRLQRLPHGQHRRKRRPALADHPRAAGSALPPPRRPRPKRRRRPAASRTRSSRSRSRPAAARRSSTPTSIPSTAPRSRCWRNCARPSTRTARSPPATPRASMTARAAVVLMTASGGREARGAPARPHRLLGDRRGRSGDHGQRADPGQPHGVEKGGLERRRSRPRRGQRGVRRAGLRGQQGPRLECREGQRQWRRHRARPSDRRFRRRGCWSPCCTRCSGAMRKRGWRRCASAAAWELPCASSAISPGRARRLKARRG